MTSRLIFSVNFTKSKLPNYSKLSCQSRKVKPSWNALQISSIAFGLRWAQKTKPCFVTLKTFFSSTAGQSFQNTKWPAVLYSVHFAWLFLIDIWQFGLAGLFRFIKFTENIWPAVELKKVLSVTKHGFVFWAQRKPNARLEIYKAFQDRLTFLNRHMIVWIGWDS